MIKDPQLIAEGAEALLREHSDAAVCALATNGLIVPVPQTIGLWGQRLIPGRALIDNVVAADRTAVVRLWLSAQQDGAGSTRVRLLDSPTTWSTLHFIDLREIHGVLLGVVLPSEDQADEGGGQAERAPAAPRFCTLTEDEGARVIAADDAFTQMFGYSEEELLGKSVLDQIHPDDQGRAVEGWLAALSTNRAQQTRLRRRRRDGTYMWVDTTLHNYLNQPGRNYVLVEIIDISAEMRAEDALQEREELLRRLTNAMPVGLLHLDAERDAVYYNQRLLEILYGEDVPAGLAGVHEEISDEPASEAIPASELLGTLTEAGAAIFGETLADVYADAIDHDIEVDIELPSRVKRSALMSVRALMRGSGEVGGAIICVLDVTDSARARCELEHRATYDPLTDLHNRSSILAALQSELEREDGGETGAVYVDLDHFKPVNDRLGHAAGDELLVLVAERLRLASRDSDLIGRLGGDEFLVLLCDLRGPAVAMGVADRICQALCEPFELACETVELRASAGVACSAAASGVGAEELVKLADAAMYRSKQLRRGLPVLSAAGGEKVAPAGEPDGNR